MMLQRTPAGWTPDQVAALDDLDAAVRAHQLAVAATAITQSATVSGAAVVQDLRARVAEAWDRVRAYDTPPDVPA